MKKIIAIYLLLISTIANAAWFERESWVTNFLRRGGRIEDITGLKQPQDWRQRASWDDMREYRDMQLPAHFNWNDFYQLQPIKNQGSCGSCWSFSITAVVESLYWIKNGNALNNWFDLAEQTLVSSCETGGSCAGGYFSAFNYVQTKGLPLESEDPYQARNTSCKSGLHPVQKIIEWHYIGGENSSPTTTQLKQAIYNYGPISVDVNGGFGSYGSGIFDSCGSTSTNHMVVLDGWTDDAKYASNGGGYWHMRNSWGKSWGENGYMRIVYKSRSGRNCNGIGNVGAYAIVDKVQK